MTLKKITIRIVFLALIGALTACMDNYKKEYTEEDLPELMTTLDSLGRDFKNDQSIQALKQKLGRMVNSPSEEVAIAAWEKYMQFEYDPIFLDSLDNTILERFPKGLRARKLGYEHIWAETTADNKAKLFKDWIETYPPSSFVGKNENIYDEAILHVIEQYVKEDNFLEVNKMTGNFVLLNKLPFYNYTIAGLCHDADKPNEVKEYLDATMESATALLNDSTLDEESRKNLTGLLKDVDGFYANLYYSEGQYNKALFHFKRIEDQLGDYDDTDMLRYVSVLDTLGMDADAFRVLENSLVKGYISEEVPKLHKSLFLRTKGTEVDYTAYKKELDARISKINRTKILEALVDLEVPKVPLQGLDGSKMNIDDLIGNVVVIDFWALWCGPCIDAFPAMANVQEYYKEEGNVHFLFVNTLEISQGDDRLEDVAKLIMEKGYDFDVYLDQPNEDGTNFQFAEALEIQGIPLKIVIDTKGRIRYQSLGYQGTIERETENMKTIIDLVKAL